jgi:antitoxin component YwqK of YwqJK toxin-antitoxin module
MRLSSEITRGLCSLFAFVWITAQSAQGQQFNATDAKGLKQGTWIIQGSMLKDPSYGANVKVEEGAYLNDEKEGLWKRYYPNGAVRSEIYYQVGKPEGPYKLYYANGKVEETGRWHDGKLTDRFQRYHSNGILKEALTYNQEGNRHGRQQYYHENGTMALEVDMQLGAEQGVQKRYDEQGQLMEERNFDNGKSKPGGVKSYTTPQQTKAAQMGASQVEQSEERKTNGAQPFDPNGYNVLYDKNGNICVTGDFMNGKLYNGRVFHYNADGLKTGTEMFTRGKSNGKLAPDNNNH